MGAALVILFCGGQKNYQVSEKCEKIVRNLTNNHKGSEAGLLNKGSCLARALGVTKLIK